MERAKIKNRKIIDLENMIKKGEKNALDKFWNDIELNGAPLIESIPENNEDCLVTIIYREKEKLKNVVLIPPVGMRKLENCILDKVEETDLWYISYIVKKDVSFTYSFSINDPLDNDWERRWRNVEGDIYNKNSLVYINKETGKKRLVPYVALENAVPRVYIKKNDKMKSGKLSEHKILSNILNEERKFSVYTPYNYDNESIHYGMLVLNDGFEYINLLNGLNVIDNLIGSGKIPPIVTIFIESTKDRAKNLQCSDEFADFIANEIIPYVKGKYNVSDDRTKNIIGGYSLGGLQASYTALKHSEVFGNVLSQSGSYWYKREEYKDNDILWINNEFNKKGNLSLKFYINVGSIEPEASMKNTNKEFRDYLISKGYEVKFEEFGSGHDHIYWGETLGNGLIYLISK